MLRNSARKEKNGETKEIKKITGSSFIMRAYAFSDDRNGIWYGDDRRKNVHIINPGTEYSK